MRLPLLAALAVAFMLSLAPGAPVAVAGPRDPLFVNLTTDDVHRSQMALLFANRQQVRKHRVSIFLNDRAVILAAKSRSSVFAAQQKVIAEIVKAGGTVLVCPSCMEHYGVAEADLVAGVKVSNPDLIGAQLFKDRSRTLSW